MNVIMTNMADVAQRGNRRLGARKGVERVLLVAQRGGWPRVVCGEEVRIFEVDAARFKLILKHEVADRILAVVDERGGESHRREVGRGIVHADYHLLPLVAVGDIAVIESFQRAPAVVAKLHVGEGKTAQRDDGRDRLPRKNALQPADDL